uniref:Envelope-like protein n=1 Tax=Heterorhabditis bacteriophora TaxID=37862 RepID=A0A1I7XG59_HETBA
MMIFIKYVMYESGDEDIDTKESIVVGEDGKRMTIRHVMVPSQKDIEEMILERKKQALIDKYLGNI